MSDEFQKWQFNAEQAIKEWPNKLAENAIREKHNYGKAERWLQSNCPDYSGNFHAKPEEQFIATVTAIYKEAIHIVRETAMRQDVK